jgi:hypothetical protein
MGHAILKVPEGRLTQTNHQRYPAIQIPHDKNQLPPQRHLPQRHLTIKIRQLTQLPHIKIPKKTKTIRPRIP